MTALLGLVNKGPPLGFVKSLGYNKVLFVLSHSRNKRGKQVGRMFARVYFLLNNDLHVETNVLHSTSAGAS